MVEANEDVFTTKARRHEEEIEPQMGTDAHG
jgi:hypothetical protein